MKQYPKALAEFAPEVGIHLIHFRMDLPLQDKIVRLVAEESSQLPKPISESTVVVLREALKGTIRMSDDVLRVGHGGILLVTTASRGDVDRDRLSACETVYDWFQYELNRILAPK